MGYVLAFISTGIVLVAQQLPPEYSWLERAGVIGLLAIAIVSFVRGWIHTDKEFQIERKEKEFYRDLAFKNLDLAAKGVDVAKELAPVSLEEMAQQVDEARRKGLIR